MNITLLTTSIFLLLSFSYALEEVIDAFGKTLQVGSYYFIETAPKPKDGPGLGLGFGAGECPAHINAHAGYGGVPLSFRPYNFKRLNGVVRVSTDLNIILSGTGNCYHDNVWTLGYNNNASEPYKWFMQTGGDVGNRGPKTVRNWFKIEKYGGYYKLVYCPKDVCKDCKVECKDIGTSKGVDGDGSHLLVLSDKPYKVQLRKAKKEK